MRKSTVRRLSLAFFKQIGWATTKMGRFATMQSGGLIVRFGGREFAATNLIVDGSRVILLGEWVDGTPGSYLTLADVRNAYTRKD